MAGLPISHVLMVFYAFVAFDCVSTLPRDIPFPIAEDNHLERSEPVAYPSSMNNQLFKIPEQEDKPKSCFHFYVSRNMSSLLAEATKMLQTIRDRREREWILTFIYRIKSLAEHLRAHPESRNYDCLPTGEDTKRRIVSDNVRGQPQPELYFVDDVPKRSDEGEEILEKIDETNSNDNQEPNNISAAAEQSNSQTPLKKDPETKLPSLQTQSAVETASDNTLTESTDEQKDISTSKQDVISTSRDSVQESNEPVERAKPDDSSIVLSSAPDCDPNEDCKRGDGSLSSQNSPENYFADAGNINPMYQSDDERDQVYNAAELYQQEALKERIRKALLEELAPEIKKLKTVGGTEGDLMSIWNSHYVQKDKSMEGNELADFDYEETGAAAGDLNLNEKVQPDRTVAPSLDEVQNSKEHSNNGKDSSFEPYDDSDVLVQQLFDVRYNAPPSKTTKSLSDQNNEYLITSTHIPF